MSINQCDNSFVDGNVPAAKPDYVAVDKCEINNEILGRTSNTSMFMITNWHIAWIIVVVVVVVIVLIAAIFFLKGKKGKRFSSAV